jgi:hypothetical protein
MDLALDEAGASETPSSVIGFDVGRQQNISTGQRPHLWLRSGPKNPNVPALHVRFNPNCGILERS